MSGSDNIVPLMLLLLLGAYLLPGAMDQWFSVDTTTWDAGAAGLWPLIPVLGLLVLILVQARKAQGAGGAA